MKSDAILARLLTPDVEKLRRAVAPQLLEKVAHPTLIILVGLPGSGKSFFAAKLVERIQSVVLESDFLRKTLVRQPVYTNWESLRVFRAIYGLAQELLGAKYNVILDATNLNEDHRRPLHTIAAETGAKAILVHLNTPRDVAEARLTDRTARRDGYSDADWAVYQQLETGFEPIKEPHFEVMSAMDISPIIDKIVLEVKQEK